MALIERDMVKFDTDATTIELEAKTGTSLLVKDILVKSVADKYLTVKIDKTTVGYFLVDTDQQGNHIAFTNGSRMHSHDFITGVGTLSGSPVDTNKIQNAWGNHVELAFRSGDATTDGYRLAQYTTVGCNQETILRYLWNKGIFKGYPLAEGQTLELSGLGSGALTGVILYDKYDAGDITSDMQNGTTSKEYVFINYGNTGSDIGSSGEYLLDNQLSPSEFPAFPYADDVPAKTEIDLIGILGCDWSALDDATNYLRTTHLKLMKGREVLLDEDRNGLPFYGMINPNYPNKLYGEGFSVIGAFSDIHAREPFMFTEPYTFKSGEGLDIYVKTGGEGSLFVLRYTQSDQRIGLIERVRYLE